MNQRIENLLPDGVITDIDHANHRCKVTVGDMQSDWLPVPLSMGHNFIAHWPIRIGTQVRLACTSGDLNQGVIIAMIPSNDFPPCDNQSHIDKILFNDGTYFEYDSDKKTLTLDSVGEIKVIAKKDISIESAENINISADANIKANGKAITLNDGHPVVTCGHPCDITGIPHKSGSSTVKAGL